LKAVITNPQLLKKLANFMSMIHGESLWKVTEGGIHFTAMDISRVGLYAGSLFSDYFKDYESPQDLAVCVNIKLLSKWLNRLPDDIAINLEILPDELILKTANQEFRLRSLELVEIPKFTKSFNIRFEFAPIGALISLIEDIELASNAVKFTTSSGVLTLESYGSTLSNVKITRLVHMHSEETEGKAIYSTLMLKPLKELHDLAAVIEYQTDYPIIFRLGEPHVFDLMYVIAPRIEEK